MLAAIVRVEGLLVRKGVAREEELDAMRFLCGLGLQVVAASDEGETIDDALQAMRATRVSTASLGAKPFSTGGLRAIVGRIGLPSGRVYVISGNSRDIAVATLAGMPTIIVGATAEGPRAAATLQGAVDRLLEPYGAAALELRSMFRRKNR